MTRRKTLSNPMKEPGYDPVELFIDPKLNAPKIKIAWTLARKMMGFRTLMNVISLDASLVKGSHGRVTDRDEDGPIVISSAAQFMPSEPVQATAVKNLILDHVFGG